MTMIKAEAAAAVISGAVERTATDAAEAAEQGDNENNKNDCTDGHVASPPARQWALLLCLQPKKRTGTHKVPHLKHANERAIARPSV